MRCVPISDSKYPRLLDADWVAPNATVIGDVKLAEGASLWHGVVVRGDTAAISIGKNSTVQDCARIASSRRAQGDQVRIG
jgi:carbonic anhydrase/acetyltransferase-like protein (isoleucine patch superfamily)